MNDGTDQPMDAWLFAGADDMMALSANPPGDMLPEEYGPWTRVRSVTLRHADEEEARVLIREHGFCCFDARAGNVGEVVNK